MNSIFQFLQSDVLARFGMTLIHSLWQIALLAVVFTHGEIHFFDVESRHLTTIKTHEKDKRLFAHGLYEITWSPDQSKVAGRIRFLGGRAMVAGGTEEDWYMYGDKELFLISKDGSFEAIAGDEIANRKESWITSRNDERPK